MAQKSESSSRCKFPVAEFFAGIGLMRMGLEQAGPWRVVYSNDIDSEKREMYRAQFDDDADGPTPDDIHKLSAEKLPDTFLATASFPCNDLSLAGAMEGLKGKQSSAFWGFVRLLRELGERRPPIVLLENVLGFLTSHDGKDFEAAMVALNELGYAVDPFVIDAAWFVPQSRKRLFVVGQLQPAHPVEVVESRLRPAPLVKFIKAHPDIDWFIHGLPEPPSGSGQTLKDILEKLPVTASEWWSEKRSQYFFKQMSARHKLIAREMIRGGEYTYATAFRRIRNGKSMAEIRTDGKAGCLRTPRGGSGRQILFKAGRGRFFVRLLTPRECARLMGADNFKLGDSTLNQALFGFGDAVCVKVVEWITQNYLNQIAPLHVPSRDETASPSQRSQNGSPICLNGKPPRESLAAQSALR